MIAAAVIGFYSKQIAEIVVRAGVLRLEAQNPSELRRRLVHFALSLERGAEIVVGIDEVGRKRERAPIMCHRVIQLALFPECVGEIVVCLGVVRFERNGPLESRFGLLQLGPAP